MWSSGLDASIGFESKNPENVGKHFINDTLTFVSIFAEPKVTWYANTRVVQRSMSGVHLKISGPEAHLPTLVRQRIRLAG